MGLLTTVVLLGLNLFASLGMSWWLKSVIEYLLLFLLLGLGTVVFYAEKSSSPFSWRAHVVYWAFSLVNVMGLYVSTKAGGFLLLLLVINLIALLRAISRLDAQEAGIVWPVTESGQERVDSTSTPQNPIQRQGQSEAGPSAVQSKAEGYQPIEPLSAFPSWPEMDISSKTWSSPIEPDVLVEDEPGVQVELETYKEGENAVPIVRAGRDIKDIKALMKRVSAGLSKRRRKAQVKRRKRRK